MSPPNDTDVFRRELVDDLDEPVKRFLIHAIGEGSAVGIGTRLTMNGRIRVGAWLPFHATEVCEATSFEWRARIGPGRLRILDVLDRFGDARGQTRARLAGRKTIFDRDDGDTARSAAARAAIEAAVWAPTSLIGHPDVDWQADSENTVIASWPLAPETVRVRLEIDGEGAVRSATIPRWGDVGREDFGYIPFGAEIHSERRFGKLIVPDRVTVGWWFNTPNYRPFFKATVQDVTPAAR